MPDIQKISELNPASFIGIIPKLTEGQRKLLQLISDKISSQEGITRDDIIDCYISSCSKDGKSIRIRENLNRALRYGLSINEIFLHKQDSRIWKYARNWFQENLGACIIKGKLLVIPVIEIE